MNRQPHRNQRPPALGLAALAMHALLILVLMTSGRTAAAHPINNYSVNQYARFTVAPGSARLLYVLDMAELPTLTERQDMDKNEDSVIDRSERDNYLVDRVPRWLDNVHATVDGRALTWEATGVRVEFFAGVASLSTMRVEVEARAAVAPGRHAVVLDNRNYPERAGWKEVVVTAQNAPMPDGVEELVDRSDSLKKYPTELLASPMQISNASFRATFPSVGDPAPGAAVAAARPQTTTGSHDGGRSTPRTLPQTHRTALKTAAKAAPRPATTTASPAPRIAKPAVAPVLPPAAGVEALAAGQPAKAPAAAPQGAALTAPIPAGKPIPGAGLLAGLKPGSVPPAVKPGAAAPAVAPQPRGKVPIIETPVTPSPVPERAPVGSNSSAASRRFHKLVTTKALTPGLLLGSLAIAFFLGALHALQPGHGKTLVAAYLVGQRGTARHAAFLGLTVTISHTFGVFLLGGVALYASKTILPEDLVPWLGFASGLIIALLGAGMFIGRIRSGRSSQGHTHDHDHGHGHHHGHDHVHDEDHGHAPAHHQVHVHAHELAHAHSHDHGHDHGHPHDHDHEHSHDHGHGHGDPLTHSHGPFGSHTHAVPESLSLRSLLALGISGGIVPCWDALIVLLGAVAVHRTLLGVLLIVAFSAGLATTLTAAGLAVVWGQRWAGLSRLTPERVRILSLMSSVVIVVLGIVMAWQSLAASVKPVGP